MIETIEPSEESLEEVNRGRQLMLCSVIGAAAVVAAVWAEDVIADRRSVLAVVAPASLYPLPPSDYPKENPPLATLRIGQPVRVLRLRYGKDFETLKVETRDGEVG